jgi:putative peptidoglycan lipid II flippase
MVLAEPFIAVLFQRGAFGAAEVQATASALTAFAAGLPALLAIKALTPSFYAREDTRTPVKIAIAATLLNVVFSLALMGPLRHVGIALAASLAAWINAGMLALVLHRRGFLAFDDRLRRRLPRMVAATLVMAAALALAGRWLDPWLAGSLAVRVAVILAMVGIGLAVFALAAELSGAAELRDLGRLLRRKKAA